WPVCVLVGGSLSGHYGPGWPGAARRWLYRHCAGKLVTVELIAIAVLLLVYLLQRLVRSGTIPHRARRQWRVALAHVRRAPWWVLGVMAVLTVVSLASRGLILPALACVVAVAPPFAVMLLGVIARLHGRGV